VKERPRIVVVDPEPEHCDLVVRTLESLGEVEAASTAEEAWALVQASEPEVVITDQRVPGMPGIELLNRAGARDAHVGRILLTSYGDTQVTIDAIDHGRVDAYVSKPCLPHQLRLTVQSVIERTQLERDNARLVADLTAKNRALREAMDSLRAAQKRVVESERLGAIGRMGAMIVHDFRGPLSVIRSAGAELERGGLDAAQLAEIAGQVKEESERMQRMCAELLDVTRASEGTLSPSHEEVDAVVEDALARLAQDAAHAGVVIETALHSGARLMIDVGRLRRALLNLGYNALEAMPEGGALRVSSAREGNSVVICVEDTGCGIPEEIRSRIFDPFVTHGKNGGSGLGLAVVKKVVEDHGGKVAADKSDGGGACFRIRLPGVMDA
jgi:signal transduction histidine kinase